MKTLRGSKDSRNVLMDLRPNRLETSVRCKQALHETAGSLELGIYKGLVVVMGFLNSL